MIYSSALNKSSSIVVDISAYKNYPNNKQVHCKTSCPYNNNNNKESNHLTLDKNPYVNALPNTLNVHTTYYICICVYNIYL